MSGARAFGGFLQVPGGGGFRFFSWFYFFLIKGLFDIYTGRKSK